MRITQSMLSSNSLRNLSESYRRMGQYQDQLSTGKKITKPSDDPVVAMKGMFYRSGLTEVEQYKRNLSELYLWMENSEAGIEQANNGLQRVRELVIQGKTGTLSPTDREAIAREVEQIKNDLVQVANTQVSGRYIFHGTDTDHPPVPTENPPTVAANLTDTAIDTYKVEVSRGVSLRANINPANVFNQEMFNVVQEIETALKDDNPSALDDLLSRLDNAMDNLSAERSELGARYNRLEMIDDRIAQQEVMANRVLSDNEDADIERVITDLKTQESVHRAALGVGARILQPTLLDFLR
ncbi:MULTISPECIES: flagellar hook-associated protein FlgL [unclassified Mesobacillus]|uniref:flagellar hook-associated protein FlgL n=1 Tax=unclassified Mesobacillus TaxID=2675270 RepID=UPI00203B3E4B|nr:MULTISPECIES: flagellar hook-associated protein FlgL [unclassified Mesobacillus]MCM3124132.1 flagellar hook-associated protein FlgL [Mesobacillus sp. MER 33]MCM3233981.1 flagellar hook-associated protein FlgL [Mesobacillus sp. MER 48]